MFLIWGLLNFLICKFVGFCFYFFAKFGKFLAIISSYIFSAPHSLLSFWVSKDMNFRHFAIVPQMPEEIHVFFSLSLKLNNFNYFQSTLFFIILIFLLCLTSKSFYFNYFIFSVLKLIFSSLHLVFLCQDFLSFNLFPECSPLLFVIALKSDNSNISAILTLSSFNCLFPCMLRSSLFSHMPSNIHYILDISNIMRFWFLE